jgi:hypothetical protein
MNYPMAVRPNIKAALRVALPSAVKNMRKRPHERTPEGDQSIAARCFRGPRCPKCSVGCCAFLRARRQITPINAEDSLASGQVGKSPQRGRALTGLAFSLLCWPRPAPVAPPQTMQSFAFFVTRMQFRLSPTGTPHPPWYTLSQWDFGSEFRNPKLIAASGGKSECTSGGGGNEAGPIRVG